jgi:CarD family transcriptional regulator
VAQPAAKPDAGKAAQGKRTEPETKPSHAKPAAAPKPPSASPVPAAAPLKSKDDPKIVHISKPSIAATPVSSISPQPDPIHPVTAVPAAAPAVSAPVAEAPPAPAPVAPQPARPPMTNGRPTMPPRAVAKTENFVEGDYVVYPTHGVGKVEKIAMEDIGGYKLELIHITFEENRMTLRVPVSKAPSAGLRKLATRKMFDEALAVLKGRARIKRTMWSRRAQEYEAKINSGDPIAIAEVVRDLHRNAGQPDQSFSERQIYEAAMDRLAAELAALDQTDKLAASEKLANFLKTV